MISRDRDSEIKSENKETSTSFRQTQITNTVDKELNTIYKYDHLGYDQIILKVALPIKQNNVYMTDSHQEKANCQKKL